MAYGLIAVIAISYAIFFTAYSLRRYDAFLMHALDMGNMDQATWFTLHGQPFHFNNMRMPLDVEAFGTTTRLSFHVEPIFYLLALLYLIAARPETLLIAQTLVLASGVVPVFWLARRWLNQPLASAIFALLYALFPALQAANLYEFHPVTLTAALLLWAFWAADSRHYGWFALLAALSAACKEEIGAVVAMMGLWIATRPQATARDRRVGIIACVAGGLWSAIALFVIVPHFRVEHGSPYWTRYLNLADTSPGEYVSVGPLTVLRYWIQHPLVLWHTLTDAPKQGYIERLLAPVAYLALLAPRTLAVGLPSLAIILLSQDQHMYGGLGHYSAELVPVTIVAGMAGARWIVQQAQRRALDSQRVTLAVSLLALVVGVWNARDNGFTPLRPSWIFPPMTAHAALGQSLLRLIPATAAVAAQDTLNPHFGGRAGIYLFPDDSQAEYVVLDATAPTVPLTPDILYAEAQRLLASGQWGIITATDGYLILRRQHPGAPHLPTIIPSQFYTFVLPQHIHPQHTVAVRFGRSLTLIGYDIARREDVNLRAPDVLLTTYWRVSQPLPSITITTYLTGVNGQLRDVFADQPAQDWYPETRWRPGQIISLTSVEMGVGGTAPGIIRPALAVRNPSASFWNEAGRQPVRIVQTDSSLGTLNHGTVLTFAPLKVVY